jgi:hypothetical protein
MLNLTPTQLLWDVPNPIVNQWEHVYLVREGVHVRRAKKSKKLREKIRGLMDKAMTRRK